MAKPSEICTCRYKHCLHEDKQLLKSEAVKVGNQYYHADCFKEKQQIADLIDYFKTNCNPDVIFPVLMRTINNIVYPKGKERITAERLLFQVKHFCTHGHHIQYPGGLYYAVQDRPSFEAYKKYKAEKTIVESKTNFEIGDEQNFSEEKHIRIKKQKSFEDIIGG